MRLRWVGGGEVLHGRVTAAKQCVLVKARLPVALGYSVLFPAPTLLCFGLGGSS